MTGHPEFYELLEKMKEIHSNKDHDYGDGNALSNFRESLKLGVNPFIGVLIRMSDKWSRICTLAKNDRMVEDEKIEDTLLDLAIYSLIAIIIRNEEVNKNEYKIECRTCGPKREEL